LKSFLDELEKEDMFKDVCILRKQKNGFYINSSSDTCIEDVNKEINFPIIKAFNTKRHRILIKIQMKLKMMQ